ncbi:TIR domain-containing protein [Paenibacillus gorillae]|uniref:TIR domain-containing protein n=1 Tax=Paenibacillus gorillae TaxID=1243662 RepID=UPI0005A629C1|nr:TIR domain-containing protein [Paenibacillus gorillae]
MAYRNGTYVAFDGNATTNPTEGDMKYYGLLQNWNASNKFELSFSDSHKKTYQVRDNSTIKTLQSRLLDRMKNSKNMLLIISKDTNWDRGMLNFEIEKAIEYYNIPIIVTYPGFMSILHPASHKNKWPKALNERIENKTAKCIHIPFKEKAIAAAVSQFSIHNKEDELTLPLHYYSEETYRKWGYVE